MDAAGLLKAFDLMWTYVNSLSLSLSLSLSPFLSLSHTHTYAVQLVADFLHNRLSIFFVNLQHS